MTQTFAERFWSRVDRSGDCWMWTGEKQSGPRPYGYIRLRWHGPRLMAHRVSFEMAHGPIPVGKVVMHLCSEPRCVRPDHLRAGTQAENIGDAWAKGRMRRKLTPATVRQLRADHLSGCSVALLAEIYDINPGHVKGIVDRLAWRNV